METTRTMGRLAPVDPESVEGKAKALLDQVQSKLGMTPNMMRTMARSPAVLEGYLGLSTSLAGGLLPARWREMLALAVGEANGCEYCVSAHGAIGRRVGLSGEDISLARAGQAADARAAAAMTFARLLVENAGDVSDRDLERVRAAGFSDGEIVEIVAHVALNIFTNYLNKVAQTEVDFPRVSLHAAAGR